MPASLSNSYSNAFNAGFDLRSGMRTTRGVVPQVDPYVTAELQRLDSLLGKRIFPQHPHRGTEGKGKIDQAAQQADSLARAPSPAQSIKPWLQLPLTPHHAVGDFWADASLLQNIHTAQANKTYRTLSELVDATPGLSTLKYQFRDDIAIKLYTLDFAARNILSDFPAITDLLVAYAFVVMELTEVDAVRNFILSSPRGVSQVVEYTVLSAARAFLKDQELNVPGLEQDDSTVMTSLASASISMEAEAFTTGVSDVVQAPVFERDESDLLTYAEENGIGPILPQMKPALIRFIQASNAANIQITRQNINYFLPGWMQQLAQTLKIAEPPVARVAQSDADFDITPFDDDRAQIQISRSAVKCASQLFYGMVLGEELQVFDAMNFFTHKYLVRGSLTIEDSGLRDDLQSYVFSNRFTDIRNKRINDRTRAAERAMFYRQVFNYGATQVNDDVVLNQEFPRLWKVLMLESAKFLERAQISPNPDHYVSRQNVLQAVEDLQYNLSTHCTGMSNVIAPLINAELEFVIQRIFMHPEVLRQVVPSGGTWWRVVETLILAMTGARPKATVIYNKAKGGNDIIRAIAAYDPAVFAQDQKFAEFIGNVERFITTQSILQDALTDDLVRGGASGDTAASAPAQTAPSTPAGTADTAAADPEWNF